MASVSNMRQNRTSITLSLVATVFLPMTFLTGVFGMNFQFKGGNGM
jgi:Mg2+ and Co2+ transporter CorA